MAGRWLAGGSGLVNPIAYCGCARRAQDRQLQRDAWVKRDAPGGESLTLVSHRLDLLPRLGLSSAVGGRASTTG